MSKSFEDQWKDAFSDASQTPPPDIWERVEAELDKKQRKGFMIWRNPYLLSGVAAAVVMVLATLFVVKKDSLNKGEGVLITSAQEQMKSPVSKNNKELAYQKESQEVLSAVKSADLSSGEKKTTSFLSGRSSKERVYRSNESVILTGNNSEKLGVTLIPENETGSAATSLRESDIQLAKLKGLAYAEVGNSFQNRREKLEIESLNIEVSPKSKEGWMSLLAANAPFNPNFSIPQFQQHTMNAISTSKDAMAYYGNSNGGPMLPDYQFTNTMRTDAQSTYKRGTSFSFGIGFGKKLKNRWSVESGVRFTSARATHQSNVYAINAKTGEYESFSMANYVKQDVGTSNVIISVNDNSQYSYNFLSVPLLLNYNILNLGRLNLSAVGGISSEILLSGNVVNSQKKETNFTSANSNFKAFNLAGSGGLRLSVGITDMLDLNLGGTYQHFLTSGIENSTNASFKPSMLGVNLGISVRR